MAEILNVIEIVALASVLTLGTYGLIVVLILVVRKTLLYYIFQMVMIA